MFPRAVGLIFPGRAGFTAHRARRLLAWALTGFALTGLALAEPLRVGVAGREPFASGNHPPEGIVVDLWEQIAALNAWTFEFVPVESAESGMQDLASGRLDVLAAETPITRENLRRADFSQPYFHSGLQILVPDRPGSSAFRFFSDLAEMLRLEIFWFVAGCVVLLTAFVFWFERRHNPDFPKEGKEGLAEAFYYVVTLALTGKSTYKGFPGVLGRVVMIVWIILGIVTVAYVTSSITSAMTVEKLKGKIAGPKDLPGHIVATSAGSEASAWLASHAVSIHETPGIEEAVAAMLAGDADAVVDDAAIVQTIDFKKPQIPVSTVGPVFAKVNLGFAFPSGSPLRIPFNEALARLEETGGLAKILAVYLGPDYQP